VSDIARDQRDFAAQQKAAKANRRGKGGAVGITAAVGTGAVGTTINVTANSGTNAANAAAHHVPPEILPLVHGAWLLKLPSATAFYSLTSAGDSSFHTSGSESPAKRTLRELLAATKASTKGRWRYFQLSHDGSTLRWDWRKFVLLVHVESVSCCTEDLTITLSLTLEPDLRLKFSDPELHATWARGLTLLVMLLGNPDGLEGRQSSGRGNSSSDTSAAGGQNYPEHQQQSGFLGRRGSLSSREVGAWATSSISEQQPGSPNRLLYRLASASGRASAAGLLSKEALEYAAWQARKALGDNCSQPPSPEYTTTGYGNDSKSTENNGGKIIDDDDLEKGNLSSLDSSEKDEIVISAIPKNNNSNGGSGVGHSVISLHATAVNSSTPRRRITGGGTTAVVGGSGGGSGGAVLRQRTPTRGRNGTPPLPNQTQIVIGNEPSPSKSRRKSGASGGDTRSWLRRTLTAPVSTFAAGFQQAAEGAARQLTFVNGNTNNITGTPPSPFDVEANAGATSGGAASGGRSGHTYSPLSPSYSSGGYVPPSYGTRRLFNTPPRNNAVPIPPSTLTSGSRSRHLRSASLDGGALIMPAVPEGSGSFTPAASLNFGPGGGVYHIVANAAHSRFAQNNTVAATMSRASSLSPGSAGGGSGGKTVGGGGIAAVVPRPRPSSPLKPANLAANGSGPATISLMAVAAGVNNSNAAPLMRYASAPMYSLQHALSGLEPAESDTSIGNPPGLPPPFPTGANGVAALQRMGSDVSWHIHSPPPGQVGGPGGALARYDSLGPQIAPGSKLWQAMFDAGMATYQMNGSGAVTGGGSVEGSPSPSATPHSVARSVVAVNMELIDFEQLTFGRMLGEGAGKFVLFERKKELTLQKAARCLAFFVCLPNTLLLLAFSFCIYTFISIFFSIFYISFVFLSIAEGPVYAAWFQETPVAVKRASSQDEVDLHLQAGWHDNVVNLRGLAQHGGHTYLVMELCPRGTLDVLIHQGSSSSASALKMDPAKLMPIVRSIARGMLHLHTRSPPVLHRDLKPANIFIGHGYVMKIGDFGMARYGADTRAHRAAQAHLDPGKFGTGLSPLLRTLTPGVIGTAAYCAPELLHPETPKAAEEFNEERLLKADVYSFGVLLWELLERKRPYYGMDGIQIQTQWILDPASMRLKPPKVPDSCKTAAARKVVQSLSDLVAVCTAWDPDERPNFKEILAILRGIGQDGEAPPTPAANLTSPF
jgi:serine/threonine protein kinase